MTTPRPGEGRAGAGRLARLALLVLVPVMALAACGGSDDRSGPSAPDRNGGDVTIEGFTFKPGEVTVQAGATVTWTNKDSFAHSVRPDAGLFPTSPDINQGTSFTHAYDRAGTFPYICGIHNAMAGTVIVS